VLELGPGTGVFTEALLRRGIEESDLVLVESNSRFAELLAARYPLATLVHADAAEIGRRLPDSDRPFGAAVSGLPLLSMPPAKVTEILSAAFAYMAPEAGLFQFTYSSRCPVRKQLLDALGLEGIPRRRVLANVWPARVYRIARKPADSAT
jgi:phosphatidylethanolamine/phosphatidyl-N-methylethanolamine N-methyltransferase